MPFDIGSMSLFYVDPVYTAIVMVGVLAVGLCMGSFSSAVAYRVLRGESWIGSAKEPARSRCPACAHELGFFDLIPLFSWGVMGGKCRYCKGKIPVLYPFLELVAGGLAVGYFLLAGYRAGWWQPLLFLFLLLPCLMSFVAALLDKEKKPVPLSLGIVGLLSAAGMILLATAPDF